MLFEGGAVQKKTSPNLFGGWLLQFLRPYNDSVSVQTPRKWDGEHAGSKPLDGNQTITKLACELT